MRWNGTIANMPAQEPIIAKTGVFALNSLKTVLGVKDLPFIIKARDREKTVQHLSWKTRAPLK